MEKVRCKKDLQFYYCRPRCKITTCLLPLLKTEKTKFCREYYPEIQPIKAVRFIQPANTMQGSGQWTNITYYPIIQGGVKYYGVNKLIPYGPPPSSPVLCRPAPLKPDDSPGMIVYSAP